MLEILNEKNFIQMPWKNGGGVTTELFKLDGVVRLSRATVSQDGPFSIFPGIDRHLLLLEGNGFFFNEIRFTETFTPLDFTGEEPIECKLINGSCIDFNVMTQRAKARSRLSVQPIAVNESLMIMSDTDYKFIYDHSENTLYKLERADRIGLSTTRAKNLLIIDVSLKDA